jgi:ComF family protein
MNTLLNQLLDLLFPPRCPGCRARGVLLCQDCFARCRKLRLEAQPTDGRRGRLLATVSGLYQYEAPLREAIHLFKYRRRPRMCVPLATLLIEALPEAARACDVIVPVPLHTERQRDRGFNQSALLAAAIGQALGKPVVEQLQRVRATAHQVGMGRTEREANVRGAFAWRGAPPPPCLLLVDDVLTTGSTVSECARALRAVGAREVHAVALAKG